MDSTNRPAQTRTVTVGLLHFALDGQARTAEGVESAQAQIAAALNVSVRDVGARYDGGKWLFSVAAQQVAEATSEQVTREELIPWTWYMSGAADFPASIARDGGAAWARTGLTGRDSAGQLAAQYMSGRDRAWFTMAGAATAVADDACILGD